MKQDKFHFRNNAEKSHCHGVEFESEEARRSHFSALLRQLLESAPEKERLKSSAIDAIIRMSDPPFYTACPNPWLTHESKSPDTNEREGYACEPFAADVSEGKGHAIYTAHAYHTKVPHRAIMRYLLHYTRPGDLVLDGFCGTGMTGVAAQYCGSSEEVQALGFRVGKDGEIIDTSGKVVSKIGSRRAILCDLSPAATFIAYNYTAPVDANAFVEAGRQILDRVSEEIGWMYETTHVSGGAARINYTVWSEVFSCPECSAEIIFSEHGFDRESQRVREQITCPGCTAIHSKEKLDLQYVGSIDEVTGETIRLPKRVPVLINYTYEGQKFEKLPDAGDLQVISRIEAMDLPAEVPTGVVPEIQMMKVGRMQPSGVKNIHHFFLAREAQALGALWRHANCIEDGRSRRAALFYVEQAIWGMSILARYVPTHYSQVNQYLSGVFYMASQIVDPSPWYMLEGKLSRLAKVFESRALESGTVAVTTQDTSRLSIPDNSVDYVFVDPPFGENIYYSDLNLLVESWHGVLTNSKQEAIIDKTKKKTLGDYQGMMHECFREFYRVLKPGRWMTVEFSNSQASVWNSIQTSLQGAGFIVANVSALDKVQGSFQAVTSTTAVKQDLVISAYKPNADFERLFSQGPEHQDGVWGFVRSHLLNLPVVKTKAGTIEFLPERDPRILFDRMVAFYVGRATPVPLSSAEFQAGIAERFAERDGMYFLTEQVAEYDRKRSSVESISQLDIFVTDERSAINWLRSFLKDKPSFTQDIQPEFMQQLLASWKKWESTPELSELLTQNFICYDGQGEVPTQITSYLSKQYRDMRGLEKNDVNLIQKAKGRWYVPDSRRLVDIELIRDRKLLDEFWSYLPSGYTPSARGAASVELLPGVASPAAKAKAKKLKLLRAEAVRAGFKHCYQKKDYQTIILAAKLIPEALLQEDEYLQMVYDIAITRTGTHDE